VWAEVDIPALVNCDASSRQHHDSAHSIHFDPLCLSFGKVFAHPSFVYGWALHPV
jgi:hypothetical protein